MKKRKYYPYLFISPFFILYLIFGIYPMLSGIGISLTNDSGSLGFQNYQAVFADEKFWKAITNVLAYMVGSMFIILPIALLAAILLNSKTMEKRKGAISTVFFIPYVTPIIVVGIVFKLIFRTNKGIINTAFMSLNLIDRPIKFLTDPAWGIPVIVIICCWRYFGLNSLYFLSGLQGIPEELGEAAKIDGANKWNTFRYITLPLLKPIATFVVFTSITGSFAIFGEVMTLTSSTGAKDCMLYPMIYLYNTMFKNNQTAKAAAMGFVIAAIVMIITSVQRWLFREKD